MRKTKHCKIASNQSLEQCTGQQHKLIDTSKGREEAWALIAIFCLNLHVLGIALGQR